MKAIIENYCFDRYYLRFILKIIFGELPFNAIAAELGIDSARNYFAAADFGTGSGYYALKLLTEKYCRIVYAVDSLDYGIDRLIVSAQKLDLSHKLEVIETDITGNLKLKDESVDIAFCCFLFSSIAENKKKCALDKILKTLTPGGRCFIMDFSDCITIRKCGVEYPLDIPQFKKYIELAESVSVKREIISKYTYSFVLEKNA